MIHSKSARFYLVALPMAIALAGVYKLASLTLSELIVGCGLCAAIASRLTDTSLIEWKTLAVMIAGGLVGMLIFQSWETAKLLSEMFFWWGVFGIPLRATIRPISERKR